MDGCEYFDVQAPVCNVFGRSFVVKPQPLTEDQVEKIIKRDEELRRDYYDMPSSFPESSQPPTGKITMVFPASQLFNL